MTLILARAEEFVPSIMDDFTNCWQAKNGHQVVDGWCSGSLVTLGPQDGDREDLLLVTRIEGGDAVEEAIVLSDEPDGDGESTSDDESVSRCAAAANPGKEALAKARGMLIAALQLPTEGRYFTCDTCGDQRVVKTGADAHFLYECTGSKGKGKGKGGRMVQSTFPCAKRKPSKGQSFTAVRLPASFCCCFCFCSCFCSCFCFCF